jgi:hypothetical protein
MADDETTDNEYTVGIATDPNGTVSEGIPTVEPVEFAAIHPQKLLERIEALTEQNEALTDRVKNLERAMVEMTTLQHHQAISIFDSIGGAINDIGQSYRERVMPKPKTKVTILRVPYESDENDQSLWLQLSERNTAQVGRLADHDGVLIPEDYPEDLLNHAVQWLVLNNIPPLHPVRVNIFVETRK